MLVSNKLVYLRKSPSFCRFNIYLSFCYLLPINNSFCTGKCGCCCANSNTSNGGLANENVNFLDGKDNNKPNSEKKNNEVEIPNNINNLFNINNNIYKSEGDLNNTEINSEKNNSSFENYSNDNSREENNSPSEEDSKIEGLLKQTKEVENNDFKFSSLRKSLENDNNEENSERNSKLYESKSELLEEDLEINKRNSEVEEKNSKLNELYLERDEKYSELSEENSELNERKSIVDKRNSEIDKRKSKLEKEKSEFDELYSDIDEENSNSLLIKNNFNEDINLRNSCKTFNAEKCYINTEEIDINENKSIRSDNSSKSNSDKESAVLQNIDAYIDKYYRNIKDPNNSLRPISVIHDPKTKRLKVEDINCNVLFESKDPITEPNICPDEILFNFYIKNSSCEESLGMILKSLNALLECYRENKTDFFYELKEDTVYFNLSNQKYYIFFCDDKIECLVDFDDFDQNKSTPKIGTFGYYNGHRYVYKKPGLFNSCKWVEVK